MSKHSEAILSGSRPAAEVDSESHASAYAHLMEARIKHASKQIDPDFCDRTFGGTAEPDDEQTPTSIV